jgi:protein O-GlcNAc transferase
VAAEGASTVLKSLPERRLRAGDVYRNTQPALLNLQELWVKGRYAQLLLSYCHLQVQARKFAGSDYVLRAYTVIGAIERTDRLFRAIYQRHTAELQPVTLSNMLFTALGLEELDQAYIGQLVQHWRRLTRPEQLLTTRPLRVDERPVLAVVSADLRMHPVGRFWLPLAQHLQQRYRLVHVGFNPHDNDRVREQLKACSDGWYLLESTDSEAIDALLRQLQPDLLLDLGGHTADNRPGLLNQRYAPVQATYLGFYGPTYGEQCEWWILDAAIARRVKDSYPGCEPIWELNGPSLCYDPGSHGLPEVETIAYGEPDHPVIGSFNHTRKLTSACLARFGTVLQAMPNAVLQFRSHSFYDPAVRRWFLRQFHEAGIAAHQLQPLAYAPSATEALNDYGRIHLHLDSYPVSGTTTTLDALAMGIPVLSCPNHLYAGAISAAILELAGLHHMVCEQPEELPRAAAALCRHYASAEARRELARRVRSGPICDTTGTPRLFAEQIAQMLKAAS